jgi:hypothetical protein
MRVLSVGTVSYKSLGKEIGHTKIVLLDPTLIRPSGTFSHEWEKGIIVLF